MLSYLLIKRQYINGSVYLYHSLVLYINVTILSRGRGYHSQYLVNRQGDSVDRTVSVFRRDFQ